MLTVSLGVVCGVVMTCTLSSEVLNCLWSFSGLWTAKISLWWHLFGATQQETHLSDCVGVWEIRLKKGQRKCLQEVDTEGTP